MSTPTGPASGLPVRMPRPRQPGRHRRPEPVSAPEGAPVLVLAVPGTPSPASRSLAEEVVSIARADLPGLNARIGFAEGEGDEFPGLREVLSRVAAERPESGDEAPPAVVVPLLAGPDSAQLRLIRQAVVGSGSGAELTDVLGPHPLLAEAVHVRLSEAGLARADRARLFTVATAADGIILATVGGDEAVQAAGITGMLLSARLAVPVLATAVDSDGAIAATARQLLESGSRQLALAPCLIGPEVPDGLLAAAAEEAGCSASEPLGSYPAIGKLVLSAYAGKIGLNPNPQQAASVR
ncbi:sirohydrochlorin chelatase [Streptomyces calidiresistens]|uniref:Sirohydrochlorin ferrochelatase n=1 Tax=Streptomyces calidiresistens TaxID=1485586 RepID=A0A7W3XYG7_9ACTN|nr:hypothetical protein [Streptomyces calidiresistens]MBB0231801.1 hypothetical protein [Streptomyces calidiresistens]